MMLTFQKIPRGGSVPGESSNRAYLIVDNWDDYSFKTLFFLTVFDEAGVKHEIGNVKIGYVNQEIGTTEEQLPVEFSHLHDAYFSLGQEAEYYQNIKEKLSQNIVDALLGGLRDIAYDIDRLGDVSQESVFGTSLLRSVSLSVIKGQYKRILDGGVPLTEYHFSYKKSQSDHYSGIDLDFHVEPGSKPSTNIHVLIGRNGVGKTTLINNMVGAIVVGQSDPGDQGEFHDKSRHFFESHIADDYFSSVVSVSFSAFDPFVPPADQPDRSQGTCFFYVGLKKKVGSTGQQIGELKDHGELCADFLSSIKACLSLEKKRERWLSAIAHLESDENFADMGLPRLAEVLREGNSDELVRSYFSRMSSGHAIVLLSITKLVETIEEKTLVLMDEPESHLHPPLLSAFTRAISDLLINRNAVAIIATHSPVVLQEVPKTCVWKLRRNRLVGHVDRPEGETFGENVGVLTREVFGLEVSKSGFHKLLSDAVSQGKTYDQVLNEFEGQIGYEGKAIVRALIASRDTR